MSPNFGLRKAADRFWNEQDPEIKKISLAWVVIGGSGLLTLALATQI
jgi:hypothetical protein